MDNDKGKDIINLVTQKTFNGVAGGIGVKLLLFHSSSGGLSFDLSLVVGGILLALAATIEFLMWRTGNEVILSQLATKQKESDKLMQALLDRLKLPSIG